MSAADDQSAWINELQLTETVTKGDYLEFFREVLEGYEEDFPNRLIESVTFERIKPLKLIQVGDLAGWAAVAATMYQFTWEKAYLERARQLLMHVVEGVERTPRELWPQYQYYTPGQMEAIREAYEAHPGAMWHVGCFSCPRTIGLTCYRMQQIEGWESTQQRDRAKQVAAEIMDFRIAPSNYYVFDNGQVNNRILTSARGVFYTSLAFPEHPHAEQWQQWARENFQKSFNRLSPEDAANYESDWFHSVLNIIDLLGEGEDAYHLPYHRAYFEHFREMVTPSGGIVGYGDSGDYGNPAVLPILEKGATVFRDGAYKYAAHQHFMAIRALPVEQKSGYAGALRWLDAYRWADDSVKPRPPGGGGTITHKGMVVLRSGSAPDQTYLALSSREGGDHGHFDAGAIAHFSRGRSELLRDGNYMWKQAFFHNRLLWREGQPPGSLPDYLRPKEMPPHPSADGNSFVFAGEGPAEGVDDKWHPAEQKFLRTEFLARLPQFNSVRTVLGPQERTIVMDGQVGCLVFDHLRVAETTTAASFYYVPEIVDRGEWWVRGVGMPEQSSQDLLIASLEPRQLGAEPQERRNMIEQVVYSSKVGAFPDGAWFVTALWPQDKGAETTDLSQVLRQEPIGDAAEGSTAQVVTVGQERGHVTYICRAANQPEPLFYEPAKPDGTPYSFTLKTDADLLRLEPTEDGLRVTIVNGTFLEKEGKRLIFLPYRGSQQMVVADSLVT